MPDLEELFSHSPEVVHPSNSPFSAAEIPGWLRLEHGEIHLFLTSRERGEYGRRHFIATLRPGAYFPECRFQEFAGASGCEWGYLLVPQTTAVCRTASAGAFAAFARENPVESAAVCNRVATMLSSACGDDGGAGCAEWLTLPETLREVIRKTREEILRRERAADGENAAE